jgi:hypothetical protein
MAIATRPVVARRAPPPPPPSFDRQMDAMHTNGGQVLPPAQLLRLRGPDSLRPNIVLAPRLVPAIPTTPTTPATPSSPAAPVVRASPAHPVPNDRRAIPERSPQLQAPAQVQRAPEPQADEALPVAAPREIAPPPLPPPRPPPPRPPPPRAPEKIEPAER